MTLFTDTEEKKKMLGSLWMAYIGSILIVGAAMVASKFVPQAWTNPNANGVVHPSPGLAQPRDVVCVCAER